ncbi:hypothetical protein FQN49_003146 [Arthroderma sp. PD_2]|nr:hypothetical protein FQN49_003146 [Arthroderma sp. PD_2]
MVGAKRSVLKVTGRVGVARRSRTPKIPQAANQANTLRPWAKSDARPSSAETDHDEAQASKNGVVIPVLEHDLLEPHGEPQAWAEDRIVLGDALPWFHSVQGGCYHLDNICRGVLIDGDCGDRSYIDDEIVITRVGGSCKKNKDGTLVMTKDHDPNGPILRSLANSMKFGIPVGLILGGKNLNCRTRIPYNFNVLDFFRITDIWFEQVGKFKGAQLRGARVRNASSGSSLRLLLERESQSLRRNLDVSQPVVP